MKITKPHKGCLRTHKVKYQVRAMYPLVSGWCTDGTYSKIEGAREYIKECKKNDSITRNIVEVITVERIVK